MSLAPLKCLELIRKATTDNERLAALLVIAKHSDQTELNEQYFTDLLDAITIPFFCRLLRSSETDGGFLQICQILGSHLLYNESLINALESANLIGIFLGNVESLEAIQCNVLISKKRKSLINIDICVNRCRR